MLPFTLLIFLLVVRESLLSPNGAPDDACASMTPQHAGYTAQPGGMSPYIIAISNDSYSAESSITVTISGTQPFKGFLIMAREQGSSLAVGTFETSAEAKGACYDGSRNARGLTHTSATLKTTLSLSWKAPRSSTGPLVFYATVVKDFTTFWVKLESPLVWESNSSRVLITTTSSPAVVVPVDISKSGCGATKSCLSYPTGCTVEDCTYLLSWKVLRSSAVNQTAVQFSVQAKTIDKDPGYASVGFARGRGMDGISIVNCITIDGGGGVAKQTYAAKTGEPANIDGQSNIVNTTVTLESGFVRCSFVWINDAAARPSQQQYDLTSLYYVVMARGKATGRDGIYKHAEVPLRTDEQIVVASASYKDYSPSSARSLSVWLLKMHGVLMLTAWMLCCTTAVILARFYKKHWLKTKLCGEKIWFAWHRGLAIGCTSLTILAFIFAFVAIGGWSTVRGLPLDAHAYLGVTVTALAIVNPIMGFFRCNPGTKNRARFNWAHWLVGNIALALAGATLLIGLQMRADVCPIELQYVAAAYVAWFVVSYLGLLLEERLGAASTEVDPAEQERSISMKSGKEADTAPQSSAAASCSQEVLRRIFLVIHLVITISVTAALIITILVSK